MIGIYLHHHGSGHRVRGTAVARLLTEPVTGLGCGSPPEGWPGKWVQLARDDEPMGALVDPTAGGVLHWAPRQHRGLLARHAQVVRWLESAGADLMVVDVSVEIALLSRLCGVPVVVAAMPGDRTDRPHTGAYDLAERLLAPWPRQAHGHGWRQAWLDKTWHVGGISRYAGRPPQPVSVDPGRVLVLDGRGGSDVTPERVWAAQRSCPGTTWVAHGGRHRDAADLWAELCRAEVVVSHGGQNAIADIATARRPAIVVAQDRPHAEQQHSVAEVQRLGLAVGLLEWPQDDRVWPGLIERARRLGGTQWAQWVPGHPAALAADLLDRLAQGLREARDSTTDQISPADQNSPKDRPSPAQRGGVDVPAPG